MLANEKTMSKNKNDKIAHNLELARNLHKSGQLAQAIVAYKKVLRAAPTHPDALHYLGLALYQTGNINDAIHNIKRAIVLAPKYPDALSNLANIYKELGRLDEAQTLYSQVLILAPTHTNTLVNMAITLRETKHTQEALSFIKQALELEPEHAIALHNLGNIYADLDQFELALASYKRALELNPLNQNTSKSLAHTLNQMGRLDDAIRVLTELIARHPEDAVAKHLLAAYNPTNTPTRASDLYVKQTFDAFSASFDTSLARLQYQSPTVVSEKLITSLNSGADRVDILDIGCGTGLCGPLFKPVAQCLIGVDLSPKMLQKASQLDVYDELHESELCAYMQSTPRQFDYVVCTDTFVYFGELQGALNDAYRVLRPKGYLIFTVEQHRNELVSKDYHLQLNGRYSHSQRYLRAALLAANFTLCSIEETVPRIENGKAVDGLLLLAQKQ
jgi:predicted TPR repeat methyltransferase